MPDRQISIQVALTGLEDATASAQGFSGAVSGVGDAAATATAAAAPLGTAIDQTAVSLGNAKSNALDLSDALKGQVGPAADAAYNAFDRLANAQGVRGLSRDIAQATIATQAFKAAVEAAQTSGQTMPAGVSAALKTMQADIDAATVKLGVFRKAQQDVAASSALAGSQLDALRGRAGSLSMMFDSMERTGTGLTKTVGAVGMGIGIASMAFVAAEATGKALGKALTEMVDGYSAADLAGAKAVDQVDLMINALRAASEGHIKLGKDMPETIANYKIFEAENSKSTGLLNEFVTALKAIKPAANMDQAAADMVTFGEALSVAYNKGSVDAALFLATQKNVFNTLVQDSLNAGNIVPDALQKIVTATKQADAAQKLLTEDGATNVITSLAKIAAARQTADDAATKSAGHAQTIFEQGMKNLNQELLTSEEYSAKKKALYQAEANAEMIAADEQVVADAKAALAQAELQKQMDLSNGAMKNAIAASNTYEQAVASGVKPSEALALAAGALRLAIQDSGAAIPKLDASLKTLAQGGIKVAEDQTAALVKNYKDLAKAAEDAAIKTNEVTVAVGALNGVIPGLGSALKPVIASFDALKANMGLVGTVLGISAGGGASTGGASAGGASGSW